MKKYIEANKKKWNELADIHFKSKFYNIEEFLDGGISISDLEINEVGDVKGKKLLHLQCHFGKDTLSWARLGAQVTGVDFSPRAIDLARQLSRDIGIDCAFIESDILELKKTPLESSRFDIVYTSHGSIYWIPDLERWAQLISHYLKPGGFFYIADFHPTGMLFDDECETDLKIRYPYFHGKFPLVFEEEGSYADENAKLVNKKEYSWVHHLGYIMNSLVDAGMHLEFIHEFPFMGWKEFPFLEQREDEWWHIPDIYPQVPLMFTLKARKM